MKKILLITSLCFIIFKISGQNFEWVRQVANSDGISWLNTSVTDSNGNIYVSGYFTGTVAFNPGAEESTLTSNGNRDIFIQKLDQNGEFLWVKQIGGSEMDQVENLSMDSADNLYVLGRFRGTVDFDSGNEVSNLTSNGVDDVFVQKLDSEGNLLWIKQIGGSEAEYPSSITTDINSDVYIIGTFGGTVNFDPGSSDIDLTSNGSNDIFILKLDSEGSFMWVRQIGSAESDFGVMSTTDVNGNVYLANRFRGTIDFDPGSGVNNITADGISDFFIEKLDSNGNFLWVQPLTFSEGEVDGSGVKVDVDGSVIVTGHFFGTIDFNPDAGVDNLSSNTDGGIEDNYDIFILKLNEEGNFIWVKQIGGTANDAIQEMNLDSDNNIYITGSFENTVDFDPGTGVNNLTSNGSIDIYIAKLNTIGDLLWVEQIGGSSAVGANSIGVNLNDELIIVGAFYDTVDFNPGDQVYNLTAVGTFDSFILKLNDNTLGIEDIVKNNVKIYPNPSNGKFSLNYDNKELQNIRIFDINGREMDNYKNYDTTHFDLNLTPGIYLMEIETGKESEILKFVIE